MGENIAETAKQWRLLGKKINNYLNGLVHTTLNELNDHRLKAVGFVAAESRFEAKASLNVLLLKQPKACD